MEPERHHVFISYPHVENAIFPGTEEGWVTTFRNGLKICLDTRLGRTDASRIWFDDGRLRRGHELRSQIEQTLQNTEAIVILLAPGYFESDWCMWEQETFCKLHADDLDGRVYVVELDRVENDLREKLAFKDRAAHAFWATDSSGRLRTLGKPALTREDADYYRKMSDLAVEIATSVKDRERRITAGGPIVGGSTETIPVVDQGPHVVIAETTDELEPRRDAMLRRLRDAQVKVTPLDSYGHSTEEFVTHIDQAMGKATHFVQLLGALPGKARPGAPHGNPQLQYERALAKNPQPKILQWRDPGLVLAEVEDPIYNDLLQAGTVQAVSFDKFRESVAATVIEVPKVIEAVPAAVAAAVAGDGAPAYVFVNYDESDTSVATEIFDQIPSNAMSSGPPMIDDPEQYRLGLETEMLECDQLMIIYGESGPRWVDMQLRLLNRTMHKRRKQLKNIFVFRTPPADRPMPPVRFPNLRVVDWQNGMKLSDVGVSFA